MVQFTTYYKDLGFDPITGNIVSIYATAGENISPGDVFVHPTVAEFARVSSECDFPFVENPMYKNFIGSIGYRPAGTQPDENINIVLNYVVGTENVLILQLVSKNQYRDIYGVCTSKKFRGIGDQGQKRVLRYITPAGINVDASYTQTIFDFIIKCICIDPTSDVVFSLAVDFTNPYFEAAVKVYLKAGFASPKISRNLNIHGNILPIPFLKLEAAEDLFDRNKGLVDINFQKCLTLKKAYFTKYIGNMIEIKISKDFNNYISNLLKADSETSVSLALSKESEHTYNLVYPCILERRSPSGGMTASLVPGSINLHTHPVYVIKSAPMPMTEGWPSCVDMILQLILDLYYGVTMKQQQLQIVVSPRGYYIFQSSQFFYDTLNKAFLADTSKSKRYASLAVGKFIVTFTCVYAKYVAVERLIGIVTPLTKYIYVSRTNQVSLTSMFTDYTEIIDRMIYIHDNHPDIFDYLSTVFSDNPEYFTDNIVSNFFMTNTPLDIVNILTFNRDKAKLYAFLLESRFRGYQEFILPLIQECNAHGIDINEPLRIATHVDDFVVNPTIESASFIFYNYDNDRPNSISLKPLQETATRDGILNNLKIEGDAYVNAFPFPADTTINNMEKRNTSENALNCDPYFYALVENVGKLPVIV
jgi:hypothetical protein